MKLKIAKLKKTAKNQGLTQTALSQSAGLSRECISQVFRGASCKTETAIKIAQALGVPLSELEERR